MTEDARENLLIIQVSRTLRIVAADDRNWVIESAAIIGEGTKKGRKPDPANVGKTVWRVEGYYGQLDAAIRGCFDARFRAHLGVGVKDLETALDAIEDVADELRAAGAALRAKQAEAEEATRAANAIIKRHEEKTNA